MILLIYTDILEQSVHYLCYCDFFVAGHSCRGQHPPSVPIPTASVSPKSTVLQPSSISSKSTTCHNRRTIEQQNTRSKLCLFHSHLWNKLHHHFQYFLITFDDYSCISISMPSKKKCNNPIVRQYKKKFFKNILMKFRKFRSM